MFPRTIKNVNTWYFHTKTSTPIDCLSTYFYRSLVRKTVCFGLYIDKTCVPDVFSESPLNTDTRIIRTLWHVPLVSVLTGFHCSKNVAKQGQGMGRGAVEKSKTRVIWKSWQRCHSNMGIPCNSRLSKSSFDFFSWLVIPWARDSLASVAARPRWSLHCQELERPTRRKSTVTLTQIAKVIWKGDSYIARVLGMGMPISR